MKKMYYALIIGMLLGMVLFITGCGKKDNGMLTADGLIVTSTEAPSPNANDSENPAVTQDVEPTPVATLTEEPPVATEITPVPGLKTMDNLLRTAIAPLGTTMYIWGGAWNEEDTGAGVEAVSFGLSEKWAEFAGKQDSSYDFEEHRYEIHNGFDCSGYIGWLVYNVIETEEGKDGYVIGSTKQAKMLADKGLGTFYDKEDAKTYKCGDIVSMKGHVWLSLGSCSDGSVLLLHSSPPGVKVSGTKLSDGSKSEAVKLAENFMKENYSEWYNKYPDCGVSSNYLENNTMFRWSEDVLKDAAEYRGLTPAEVLGKLAK